ncbi:RRQRL motif-containing zinc-binding protein [Antrihabitans stalactiti]|uniref:Uncharacterized protein n=1 Tax=Antrihabitans stalactiti TaxID=2584121 RepID=A0A848KN28_9NOCA|nr:RRQRL motif-containing zinc-binding protein [Antrihabitans stalactiti]NMN99286.1 hypothetical protein [Antrihabitans stalactiti]
MIGPVPASWREFKEDPTGERHHGVPLHFWRNVPTGLATRRQLDRMGLRRNGQDIAAQAVLLRKRRVPLVAYFYRVDQAAPKRTPSQRQLEALTLATWTRQADAMERHGLDATGLRQQIEGARADIAERAESRLTTTDLDCRAPKSARTNTMTRPFASGDGFDEVTHHGQEWDR